MKRLIFFILFCFFSAVNLLRAQQIDENNFVRYTKLQGLSHNFISGITQDAAGYIWIATHKGLNRFDGHFFNNFFKTSRDSLIPDNLIQSLHIQDNNEIIGTTLAGAFVVDAQTFQHRFLIVPSDSSVYFWTNNGSDILRDYKGNYLVSTRTGFFVFSQEGKIIARYDHYNAKDAGRLELLFGNRLQSLKDGSVLQQNQLYFSIYNPATNEIHALNDGEKEKFSTILEASKKGTRNFTVNNNSEILIFNEEKNSLDVAGIDEPVISQSVMPFSINAEIDPYSRLFPYDDSTFAITGKVAGFYLLHYDKQHRSYSCDGKKYFKDKFCTYFFRDKDGRGWIGTSDGLYMEKLSYHFFESIDLAKQFPELINHEIRAITARGNKLFVGLRQDGGILLLNKTTGKIEQRFFFNKFGAGCNDIHYLFDYHPDTIWVGTAGGILWINTKNYAIGKIKPPQELEWINQTAPYCFMEDSKKNIWISFQKLNSIVSFNKITRTFSQISTEKNPLLKTTYVWSMAEDKQGNIWLAGDGICRWNVGKQMVDTLIQYPKVSSSLRNFMLILHIDESNNLWLSSFDNEIIQYNCSTNRMYLRKEENSFLDGNTVTSSPIIHDNIWMGTDNGISAFNVKNYSIRQFSYMDGLPSVAITSYRKGSYYDEPARRLYMGAKHYLISFVPDIGVSKRLTPDLNMEKMTVAGVSFFPSNDTIKLKYFQNNIQLNFNAINFNDPEEDRFACRLISERDSSWHDLSTQNMTNFNNLAAGNYRVQVKLFSINNRWPSLTREFGLIIQPPFWQTGWFRTLMIFLILATGYLFYRNRIQNIRKKAGIDKRLAEMEMKALHAQMNPHFIFNSLNSIKDMILHDEQNNASRYLSRFAQLIRLSLEHSKQTFITLRQNIEHLQHYLSMEQLRFADFSYAIHVDENLPIEEIKITPMLIQPLVENAIWHGVLPNKGSKKININFYARNEMLIIEVEDNGIGINAALQQKVASQSVHQSLGIENIQKRIKLLNEKYNMQYRLEIIDLMDIGGPTSGTKVRLSIPINEVTFAIV
ncbi:MAG: histidine kinase [Bacteroidetes bacterium]|nr:histidine kinase [Bacteroidota bacterium]